MKWLESKDEGKTNRVNIKHVIGYLGEVEKDSVVTMRFNSRRYRAKVVDLLVWKPTEQRRKKHSNAAKKATKPKASKRQQKALILARGSPAKGQEDSASMADSAGRWSLERLKRHPEGFE